MKSLLRLKDNLLARFSLVSFVIMFALAATLAVVLSNVVRADALNALAEEAIGHASGRLRNALTPEDLRTPMTGERYDAFHHFVQQTIVSERTARIKIWANDGTVIYSNDRNSVGEKFPDNASFLKAMQGEVARVIKMPVDPENARERFLGTLMEIYTPVYFPGDSAPAGVFEIYQFYEPTAQRIRQMQAWVFGSIALGFVVLYGGLVSIVWGGWRTIRRQQTALTQANAELQEAMKAKDEMVANVSHELRTPLAQIIGYSELLNEGILGRLDGELIHAIRVILDRAQALTRLVDGLLTLQTLSPADMAWEPVDVGYLLRSIQAAWQEQTTRSGLMLQAQVEPDLPAIRGDAARLQQAFDQLLDNALKFTPAGGTVSLQAARRAAEVWLSVADTGIGIPPDKLSKIFDRFYQVDGSTTRRYGGAGIGLALVSKIVGFHGGRVWADSDGVQGHGATLVMALPAVSPAAESAREAALSAA